MENHGGVEHGMIDVDKLPVAKYQRLLARIKLEVQREHAAARADAVAPEDEESDCEDVSEEEGAKEAASVLQEAEDEPDMPRAVGVPIVGKPKLQSSIESLKKQFSHTLRRISRPGCRSGQLRGRPVRCD